MLVIFLTARARLRRMSPPRSTARADLSRPRPARVNRKCLHSKRLPGEYKANKRQWLKRPWNDRCRKILDAERSVLGAILLDNHTLNAAIEKLKPEDFFDDRHRRIFNHMIQLGEAQQAIDLVTLTDQLRRKGELEADRRGRLPGAIGGRRAASFESGALRTDHQRKVAAAQPDLRQRIPSSRSALDAEEDADALLDRAESSIFQIAEDRIRTGLVSMKDVVHDNMERLERVITEGKRITGLATNYAQLDNLTSGLQPSELIILAARPSVGKTAFALNIAENVALHQQGQWPSSAWRCPRNRC